MAKSDVYPLPHVDELYAKLSGGETFTKLDLSNAYQQLELDDESKERTTINTEKGLFAYNRMPFGISTAPSIIQKHIDTVLNGISKTVTYLDDILVTGKDGREHFQILEIVLQRLSRHGFKLSRPKC